MSTILDQYAKDEEFREGFHTNTNHVLANAGIIVPLGVDIEVVLNSEVAYHLVLTSDPNESLSDDMIEGISGGDSEHKVFSSIASIPSTFSSYSSTG